MISGDDAWSVSVSRFFSLWGLRWQSVWVNSTVYLLGSLGAYWFGFLLIVCVCSAVWLSMSRSFSPVNLGAVWSLVKALWVCGEEWASLELSASCSFGGASPEGVRSSYLSALYECLVKWVYTVLDWRQQSSVFHLQTTASPVVVPSSCCRCGSSWVDKRVRDVIFCGGCGMWIDQKL